MIITFAGRATRRPRLSASWPNGRFRISLAKLGEDTNKPTELCESPNSWPYNGSTGINAPTATKTGNCDARSKLKSLSLASSFGVSITSPQAFARLWERDGTCCGGPAFGLMKAVDWASVPLVGCQSFRTSNVSKQPRHSQASPGRRSR